MQADGYGNVLYRYLRRNASKLARKAKIWRGTKDIESGLVIWEVACKPGLNYGSEVLACSSLSEEKVLKQIQERAG